MAVSALAMTLATGYGYDPAKLEQLRTTHPHQCSKCDLSGAQLGGWELGDALLNGANLNRRKSPEY